MKLYRTTIFVLIALIIILGPASRLAPGIWSAAAVTVLAYSAIFISLLKRVFIRPTAGGSRIQQDPAALPIILFLSLAVFSFIIAVYKHDSLYSLFRLVAYTGLYFIIASDFNHKMRKRIILFAISTGVLLSVYGLLQYAGLLSHPWWSVKGWLSSTYRNHNHFAGWLELVIPVTITMTIKLFADEREKSLTQEKIFMTSALTVMAAAFLLAQSRGAWVSLIISIIMMAVLMIKKSGKIWIIAITVMALAVLSLLYFSKDVVSSRVATLENVAEREDLSAEARILIWQGALRMIAAKPILGFGIGCFESGFSRYRPQALRMRAIYAFNELLNMASEMGTIAPMIMFWVFLLIISRGYSDPKSNPYTIGCATGILSLAIHCLGDYNFHIPPNMALFVIWMAIISGELYGRSDRASDQIAGSVRKKVSSY